jgi:hypothetical protein
MTSSRSNLRTLLVAFASCCPLAFGAQVNPPTFDPDGLATRAPLKVTLNCPIPDASIYVTLDGTDPTTRDTELDPGSTILLDEPCTLKARVVLADGSSSAVKTGVYTLLPVKGLAATFVEQEAPAVMSVGQAMDAEVVCRNLGTTRWEAGQISLVPRRAKDAAIWGVSKVPLTDTVAMWKTATFSFRVTAPSEPGTYNFQWLLQDAEGKSFGEPTAVVRIRVVPSNQQSAETKSTPESSNQLQVSRAGKADPGLIQGTRSRRETTASEVR